MLTPSGSPYSLQPQPGPHCYIQNYEDAQQPSHDLKLADLELEEADGEDKGEGDHEEDEDDHYCVYAPF